MTTFDEKKTYQAGENKKGNIVLKKSTSWLSGATLNALQLRGVTVIVKNEITQ
jgi:hypothetical protein